jgi:TPP-dependent pyruvate/acetoin dehydrogenase alpha subunit
MFVMDNSLKLHMLRTMIRIRVFELNLYNIVRTGVMPGFLHLCLGQEATATGCCAALNNDDYIVSTHRGHGHCIAKGVDPKAMMAELYGKATGTNKGKGGSMHIASTELGILGANGIVGAGIPLATGAAFSAKYFKNGRVALCFFGEGASNQGTFHESINIAGAYDLPVVYVCEFNGYSLSTDYERITRTRYVSERASAYGIRGVTVDGNDVTAVYEAAKAAVDHARNGYGPTLLECRTYRWDAHNVGGIDKRPKEEIEAWKKKEPIEPYAAKLIEEGIIDAAGVERMWEEVREEMRIANQYGLDSPYPAPETALEDIYTD